MYPILNGIFSDKKSERIFNCFGIEHWIYILLIIATVTLSVYLCRNKERAVKDKVLKIFIGIAFGLYVADFFLMPFAYEEIDIDKLPFHSCTAMSVACFFSNHDRWLKKYRVHFALLGFISNLMYISYPAGIMAYEIHPLSYRALQTLLFHSVMVIYGLLAVIFDRDTLDIKKSYRDLVILGALTVWALIGNTLYSGAAGDYNCDFNWFFIKRDPFGISPESISPYILPFVNIAAFFAVEIIVYLIFRAIGKRSTRE